MAIDPSVQARAEKLRIYLRKLEAIKNMNLQAYLTDPFIPDAAERNLQLAIEALTDIGNHIISKEGFETPEVYADIFRILCKHRILPTEMEENLVKMTALRNLLVHGYVTIDTRRIHDIIVKELDTFKRVASIMIKKLERTS